MSRAWVGVVASASFVGTIVAANALTARFGMVLDWSRIG